MTVLLGVEKYERSKKSQALLMTTDKVAGRAPWHSPSPGKRARCGAPDLMSPVQNACHLIFQLAAASRLLGMTKRRGLSRRRGRLSNDKAVGGGRDKSASRGMTVL